MTRPANATGRTHAPRTRGGLRTVTGLCLLLFFCFGTLFPQKDSWERQMEAAREAFEGGRYLDAEEQLKAALRDVEQYGREDPRVATTMAQLAEAYRAQGKNGEAEILYLRLLTVLEEILGPDSPAVAQSLNNLAFFYYSDGNYEKAEGAIKRLVGLLERRLGPDHSDVGAVLKNYATLLRKMGRTEEADRVQERVEGIQARETPE